MSAEHEQQQLEHNAAVPVPVPVPVPNLSDNGAPVPELLQFAEEDVGPMIEAIASTGAFWIEWDKLKGMLSFKLKQVLSEYPDANMTPEQQITSLGETYQELVCRLDEALLSFDDGPPFTLQRLCEILLSAKSIYPKLSKLALALEKNLLVSSMLMSSVDPRSQMMVQGGDSPEKVAEKPEHLSPSEQNGGDAVMSDRDEMMADAEEGISMDMETAEETVQQSEINPAPAAATATETAETAPSNS